MATSAASRMLCAALLLLACLTLTACPGSPPAPAPLDGVKGQIVFEPAVIPVTITASTDGTLSIQANGEWKVPTPLGTFAAGVSIDPAAMFGAQGVEHVLVVEIDGEQHVYDLHGQNVDVSFEDGYYRALRIYQDSDANWYVILQKMQSAARDCRLPNGEMITAESLARQIGGDAEHWTERGGDKCVWGYWNPDVLFTFRHPGGNTMLTYWSGFAEPRNSRGCWVAVPEKGGDSDGTTRVVQCPEAGAEFEADGVGFHPYP